MKKFIIFSLLIVIVASLCACNARVDDGPALAAEAPFASVPVPDFATDTATPAPADDAAEPVENAPAQIAEPVENAPAQIAEPVEPPKTDCNINVELTLPMLESWCELNDYATDSLDELTASYVGTIDGNRIYELVLGLVGDSIESYSYKGYTFTQNYCSSGKSALSLYVYTDGKFVTFEKACESNIIDVSAAAALLNK